MMRRLAIVLGLLLHSLEQVSDAFVFGVPASKLAACRENGATACSMASRFAASCQLPPSDTSGERRTEELHRQRYRGQVSYRAAGNASIEPVTNGRVNCTSRRVVIASFTRPWHSSSTFVTCWYLLRSLV